MRISSTAQRRRHPSQQFLRQLLRYSHDVVHKKRLAPIITVDRRFWGAIFGYNRLMLKLFLLVLAAWLIVAILKRYRAHTDGSPPVEKSGNMVRCAVCGVHTPESEAVISGGQHYCCEAHFLQRKKE